MNTAVNYFTWFMIVYLLIIFVNYKVVDYICTYRRFSHPVFNVRRVMELGGFLPVGNVFILINHCRLALATRKRVRIGRLLADKLRDISISPKLTDPGHKQVLIDTANLIEESLKVNDDE